MAKTLQELREENARAEEEQQAATQPIEAEATDTAEEESNIELEDAGEQTQELESAEAQEGTDEPETSEAWMHSEDEASQAEKPAGKFTDDDMRKMREKTSSKYQRKVDEKDAEIERLKAAQAVVEPLKPKPKKDDFYDADDPEDAYMDALWDWKQEKKSQENNARAAADQQKQAQADQQAKIDASVNRHIARTESLVEKLGRKSDGTTDNEYGQEMYINAERTVRQAVDSVFPDAGDPITDYLIANLGEGSAEIMYHLGVNSAKRAKLIDKLKDDRNGVAAAVYLGEIKAMLKPKNKLKTSAPKPAPKLQGDKRTTDSSAFERKYQQAHKSGDTQKAFNYKRQAKAAGVNTRDWR